MSQRLKPRVLLLDFSGYGVMTHVLSFLDYADRENWEYVVIHASDDQRPGVDSYRSELARRHIQSWSIPVRQAISADDAGAVMQTLKLIRSLKPDLLHCHSTKAGFVGRICATLAGGIPAVFTPHSFSFQMAEPESRKYRTLVAVERALGRRTARIAPVSETERNLAIDLGICPRDRAVLIRNGVHLGRSDNARALGRSLRAALGVCADEKVVCFVGRFAPQKMPNLVVETAAKLRDRGRRTLFLFLGNGPMEDEIQEMIRDKGLSDCCRWLGWQPYEQALGYLAASDIMLLPSRYEGLPYVALEAQALGTVPVLTSVPGSCDAVVPGETAITTAFGDVDAMADAIVRLSDDSHLLTRMADKGRQFVEEKFSAESMTRAIEAMYGKVLSERIKARR